jgi:hypothetical protein
MATLITTCPSCNGPLRVPEGLVGQRGNRPTLQSHRSGKTFNWNWTKAIRPIRIRRQRPNHLGESRAQSGPWRWANQKQTTSLLQDRHRVRKRRPANSGRLYQASERIPMMKTTKTTARRVAVGIAVNCPAATPNRIAGR